MAKILNSGSPSSLDVRNGDLVLADAFERIGASTSRDTFQASKHGKLAKAWVANGPWRSFRFEATGAGGERLIVMPQFHGQELIWIDLAWPDDQFEFKIVPWDEASCLKEKAAYESWLKRLLGSVSFQAEWGRVAAYYDSKGGSSFVQVDYIQAPGLTRRMTRLANR